MGNVEKKAVSNKTVSENDILIGIVLPQLVPFSIPSPILSLSHLKVSLSI